MSATVLLRIRDALSLLFWQCEPFVSCHSEGAEQPKDLTQAELREAISRLLPSSEIASALRASQSIMPIAIGTTEDENKGSLEHLL